MLSLFELVNQTDVLSFFNHNLTLINYNIYQSITLNNILYNPKSLFSQHFAYMKEENQILINTTFV